MKKSYLFFCFLFLTLALNAQTMRVDYDNASKWFLGVNVGGTWNSTDVQNKSGLGWGLTLGRSFNYTSYGLLSFDLRARYLRGFWYGQDYDTTSMAGYAGGALNGYSSQGMIAHNFQTDVHRLGFELAVHLNRLTSRTGWDPYVFGGVGFTWHQAYGDLINQTDTSGVYDYASMVSSGIDLENQIDNSLDGIYDSNLDGFSSNSYNVAFMPSLGFGLGYHIGKRITLGLEHKTTFTLRDDFDGLVSQARTKKDRYHYTSLYLQFRVGGGHSNNTSTSAPCNQPRINVLQPTGAITVTNPQYTFEATVAEATSSNQISITTNTGQNLPFEYNTTTKQLRASVQLVPGVNSYTIRVYNSCGFDSKVVSLTYLNCTLPTAVFTNPANENTTVRNAGYSFTAALTGITDLQGIKFFQNNVQITGFSFNSVNGLLVSNLTLQPGVNTFRVELINSCGSNVFSTSLNYDNCVAPVLSLVTPSATGTTVNTPLAAISFLASNIANANQLSITQNGVIVGPISLNNGKASLNTTLSSGLNTFVVNATNACGNVSQTFTIDYQSCNAPLITLDNPSSSGITVASPAFVLKGKVSNIDSKQNVVIRNNGNVVNSHTYSKASGSLEAAMTLATGPNILTVTTTNGCGVDVETVTINYIPCIAPVITLGAMNNVVTNSSYLFSATILNQATNQGVNLTLNGQPINFSYNNGLLSASVNLATGNNTFVLSASTNCGQASKTWNVNNNNCIPPVILLSNPTATGTTVNTAPFVFKSILTGMNSSQGISLTLNGVIVPFTYSTGLLTSNVTLNPGVNTFKLTLQNNCGNATNEIVVNFQNCTAPIISVVDPISPNSTVTSASLALKANILNVPSAQNISVKLNGMGIAFQYVNSLLTANLSLQPGANTVLISSSNDCGTDVEAINVIYNNCTAPAIQVSNIPSLVTTTSNTLAISATVTGSNLSQGITLTQNGNIVPHSLIGNSLTASVQLSNGANIFVISAVNSCGADAKTFTVTYAPCISPLVAITNPANTNLTLNTGNFTFQASTQHVNSGAELILLHNGTSVTNFNFNNGQVVAPLTLTAGINTIVLTATTSCGTSSKTVIINGKNCDAPVISIGSPANSGLTVNNAQFLFQASLSNLTSNQGITLSNNGNPISGYTYANGQLTATLLLVSGQNNLVLAASNECGNSSKTIVINYAAPCNPLSINFLNTIPSGGSTNATSIALSALIQNYTANTAVTVKVNGNPTNNYTNVNGLISGQLNIPAGTLTIEISATNNCGTATETYSISRCKETTVTLNTPNTAQFTTSNSTQLVKFNVANVASANQITLTLNGQSISGFNFSGNEVSATLPLNAGVNIVGITVNNGCNTANQSITINQSAPCNPLSINFLNTIPSGGATNATSMALSAQIQNYTANTTVSVKVNGNPTNNYTNLNGLISGQLNLPNGTLTIEISATNNCGTATETYSISRCKDATVTLNTPNTAQFTTASSTQLVKFNVANVLNANQIVLTLNGQSISGFNFSGTEVSANVPLVPGINVIEIAVNNGCNSANQAVTITQSVPCNPLSINFLNTIPSGGSTNAASMALSAQIQNYTANTTVTVKVNGNPTTNYSNVNGLISGQLNLPNGTLTIEISATNNCGTATETYSISRCKDATVTLNSPASSAITTSNLTQVVSFNVANVSNVNQIQLLQNGQAISGFNFTSTNVNTTLNLIPGVNTIQLIVNNGCNTASQNVTITYTPVVVEQTILICVTPADNPRAYQTLQIPISQWPAYQAQGAVLGACVQPDADYNRDTTGLGNGNDSNSGNGQDNSGSGNDNGNNGHGNNQDGVDSSNPGQGGGGPNGTIDQSGAVDDENGNGNTSNGSGNTMNGNVNNQNSGQGLNGFNTNSGSNSSNGNNGNNGNSGNSGNAPVANPGRPPVMRPNSTINSPKPTSTPTSTNPSQTPAVNKPVASPPQNNATPKPAINKPSLNKPVESNPNETKPETPKIIRKG